MSVSRDVLKTSLVLTALVFSFSSFAAAQGCCSASKTKVQASSDKACCTSSQSAQAGAAVKEAEVDAKLLKTIYAAASTGDFSAVQACPATRSALLKLSEGNEHTLSMVKSAEKSSDYKNVAACKVTRGEISQAVMSYALNKHGVSSNSLQALEQAALSGDFSKVSACKDTQALLRKVVEATPDFHKDCKDKVMEVVEGTADFSMVAACEQTRAEIDQAVKKYRESLLNTSMAN